MEGFRDMIRLTSGEAAIIRMLEANRALLMAQIVVAQAHCNDSCGACQHANETIKNLAEQSAKLAGSVLEVPYETS